MVDGTKPLKLETSVAADKLVGGLELASSQGFAIGGLIEVIAWLLVGSKLCVGGCILGHICRFETGTVLVLGR